MVRSPTNSRISVQFGWPPRPLRPYHQTGIYGGIRLSLSSSFPHSRFGGNPNPERLSRIDFVACAHPDLLASYRLGSIGAADLLPKLVGDVRIAPLSAMDVCRICGRLIANHRDLHARRINFSRFVR